MRPASVTFAHEVAREIKEEFIPLARESWKSLQRFYPSSKLRPDFDLYIALDEQNMLKVYTVRADGIMIGYAVVLITPHPHRVDDQVAAVDSLFVLPQYRVGGTALRFIEFVASELKRAGVCSMTIVARDPRFERWLRFAHYRQVETVWERMI